MPMLLNTAGPLPAEKKSETGILTGLSEKILKFRTAQLHIQKPLSRNRIPGKAERTSHTERSSRACFASFRLKASLTVETALALPVIIVFFCTLLWPIRIISAQQQAQLTLEQAAEYSSAAEYLSSELGGLFTGEDSQKSGSSGSSAEADGQKNTDAGGEGTKKAEGSALLGKAEKLVSAAAVTASYDQDVLGIPLITKLKTPDENDNMTELAVSSVVNFPFTEFSLMTVKTVASRRAWVGREGGAGRKYAEETEEKEDAGDGETDGDEDDEIVFVANNSVNSGRYHVSRSCHYISNLLKAVPAASVAELRNDSGGKYHACPSCHPGSTGTVYIFKSGDAYHASKDCKAIGSYVTEMKKSEAERKGLSPCSYCGGKH